MRARRLGQQLRTEANAENRHSAIEEVSDHLFLARQPRMGGVLVDVHFAAEDHRRAEPVQRRRRSLARRPLDHIGRAVGEDAGSRVRLVDDAQEPGHSGVT